MVTRGGSAMVKRDLPKHMRPVVRLAEKRGLEVQYPWCAFVWKNYEGRPNQLAVSVPGDERQFPRVQFKLEVMDPPGKDGDKSMTRFCLVKPKDEGVPYRIPEEWRARFAEVLGTEDIYDVRDGVRRSFGVEEVRKVLMLGTF
jgi:hypothetical protein